jgi:protein phosphatase
LTEVVISRNTLAVLCGPAGSGKSTWAAKHFLRTQVVSSDECRAMVSDDAANQTVSQHAFDLMHFIIEKRLRLGRLTVADATNLKREHRLALVKIAKTFHFNTAAIVFKLPIQTTLARNAARNRRVPEVALMEQYSWLARTLLTIENDGFNYVYYLDEFDQENGAVRIVRRLGGTGSKP